MCDYIWYIDIKEDFDVKCKEVVARNGWEDHIWLNSIFYLLENGFQPMLNMSSLLECLVVKELKVVTHFQAIQVQEKLIDEIHCKMWDSYCSSASYGVDIWPCWWEWRTSNATFRDNGKASQGYQHKENVPKISTWAMDKSCMFFGTYKFRWYSMSLQVNEDGNALSVESEKGSLCQIRKYGVVQLQIIWILWNSMTTLTCLFKEWTSRVFTKKVHT